MSPSVLIINGPNINLLGSREPALYGHSSLAAVEASCRGHGEALGLAVSCLQSNHEGALIDAIHGARDTADAIIINAGAYSHSSIAIMDALRAYDGVVIEVHLSNIYKREAFRRHSYVSLAADAVICGLGPEGYRLALDAAARLIEERASADAMAEPQLAGAAAHEVANDEPASVGGAHG